MRYGLGGPQRNKNILTANPVNIMIQSLRCCARSALAAVLIMAGSAAANGADTYSAGLLTMPTLLIGGATYTDMVVRVGSIVSGPAGSSAYGIEDSYDPDARQLTVQTVTVGVLATYYNVIVTVAGLVSIGAVSGADTYSHSQLMIPFAQVQGGSFYTDVVIDYAGTVSVAGGMPAMRVDSFNPSSGELAIPAFVNLASGRIYTNVIAHVGKLQSLGRPGYVLGDTAMIPGVDTARNSSSATVTVIPANGYTGRVSLSCGLTGVAISTPACSFNPSQVTLNDAGAKTSALTVSTSSSTPGGPYTFTVNARDLNNLAPSNGAQAMKLTTMAVIQHIVVIFQENRTTDNLFHDPVLIARGADIASSGLNSLGETIPLTPIDLGTAGANPQNYDLQPCKFCVCSDVRRRENWTGPDLIDCAPAIN